MTLAELLEEVRQAAQAEGAAWVEDVAEEVARVFPFVVDDEDRAAWVVNKILAFDDEEARIRAQYDAALRDVARRRERFADHFLPELRRFFPAPAEGPRYLDLPTGRLAWRRKPADVSVVDVERVADWLEEHRPDLVLEERVRRVDTAAVKRLGREWAATAAEEWAAEMDAHGGALEDVRAPEEAIAERMAASLPAGLAYRPETDALYIQAPKGSKDATED